MRFRFLRWVGIFVLLAGCSRQQPSPPAPDETARPSGPEQKGTSLQTEVAVVSPALVSVFHVTLVEGAIEEGKKLGWKVDKPAPQKESNFADQVNMVEDLVQRKVSAISICAINDKAIAGAVEAANRAGIPIFIHNSLTELPGKAQVVAYIGYDQREGGRKCGQTAVALLTKKYGRPRGKVAIIEGIPGFHTTERKGGFLEGLDLKRHPDIKVVASQPADWERSKAMNVAENLLQKDPDIDLFFGCSDAMAQGASQAAQGMGKKVFTIGIDGNPDALEDVRKGNLTATLAVFPEEMGRRVIRTMAEYLNQKKVPRFVKTNTEIVTRENVDRFLKKPS